MNKYNVCFTVGAKKIIVEDVSAENQHDAITEAREDSRLYNKPTLKFNWCKEV